MKKLLICLLLLAMLFSVTGCVANIPETLITEVGEPYDPMAGEFLTPPKGYVVTQDGNIPLKTGGYSWSVDTGHGTGKHMIADQAERPVPVEYLETVRIVQESPIDGKVYYMGDTPEMIEYGAKIKLDWQVKPDTLECTFWPADYEETGKTERKLLAFDCDKDGFMAYLGSYIYELSAAWGNHGAGYSGKATYYIHVIIEQEG